MIRTAFVIATLLTACARGDVEPKEFEAGWHEVEPIVTALAYEQGIRRFCGEDGAESLDVFLAELKQTPGAKDLLPQAKAKAADIRNEFDAADPEDEEYVCTVEMWAGSEERADVARADWLALKDNFDD